MIQNKFFGVVGLGISGIATIRFFIANNYKFILWDDNINFLNDFCQKNNLLEKICVPNSSKWQEIELLIKSPGISLYDSHNILDKAKERNIPIISDIELFYLLNPQAKYIAITGTNGKSTTTQLIGYILQNANLKVQTGGNIGKAVMSLEHNNSPDFCYVLEISSYQLASICHAKFNIAVVLNITPDHLEWHKTMAVYIKDKFNIIKNHTQDDILICNGDDKNINNYLQNFSSKSQIIKFFSARKRDSFYIHKNKIFSPGGEYISLPFNPYLLGKHNAENILASYLTIKSLGINDEIFISSIKSFIGLKHRMQPVGRVLNINFINDSKATNFESTEKALSAINDHILLIMGGKPKEGYEFKKITKFSSKIKKIFLIGEAENEFFKELTKLNIDSQKCNHLDNAFKEAIKYANNFSTTQMVILLSPGCASFDQWNNFEDRGDYFIKLVNEFKNAIKL